MKRLKDIKGILTIIIPAILTVACDSTECPINNVVYSTYGF